MHAGGIWGWNNWGPKSVSHYSLGMRQRLFQEFGNAPTSPEPRIIVTSSRVEDSEWDHSKYCLAPAGDGFGLRMAKSAALNCVPLIAQPFVVQGFEDLLPYARFSKRLEFDQVPQLPAMLRSILSCGGTGHGGVHTQLPRVVVGKVVASQGPTS